MKQAYRPFIISTDSTADLPADYVNKEQLVMHPLYYSVEGKVLGGDDDIPPKDFYDLLRNGKTATTMASNIDYIRTTFQKQVDDGYDILHISFSSALSGSHSNACVTAREVADRNPQAKIIVLDSLCASLGQGLLVHLALEQKKAGKTLEEIAEWIEANKLHICHQFTVDDLNHLHRGGRVSKTVAVLGTLINVKPVMHVNNEGKLIPLNNVRGRKKSLIALVDNMEKGIKGYDNQIIFISHGDCLEDAKFVASQVKERFGIENILINYVSPTIGAHSGPGTVALFYIGESR